MKWHLAAVFGIIFLEASHGAESLPPLKETPQNIEEVWSGYDPALEPIEARVVREWEEEGCNLRYILYSIGHFKGKPAIMAGFYGFPSGQNDLPAVMHMHGGGHRAFLQIVKRYAQRGYAALSVNWGGRLMEGAQAEDPNTD